MPNDGNYTQATTPRPARLAHQQATVLLEMAARLLQDHTDNADAAGFVLLARDAFAMSKADRAAAGRGPTPLSL